MTKRRIQNCATLARYLATLRELPKSLVIFYEALIPAPSGVVKWSRQVSRGVSTLLAWENRKYRLLSPA